MNSKVVVAWIVVIVLLLVVGILGAANQDILEDDKPEEPVFVKLDNSENCKVNDPAKSNVYSFVYNKDDNDKIDKLVVTYRINYPSHELYEAAAKLCGSKESKKCPTKLSGITMILEGWETDFYYIMTIDLNKINEQQLKAYEADMNLLELVIKKETSLAKYKELLPVKEEVKYECSK